MRIGYLIPEFPGQTHIFFWREMEALRLLGIEPRLVSTRRPPKGIVSHSWASEAEKKTIYLGEMDAVEATSAVAEFIRCGPLGWFKAIKAAISGCPLKKIPRNLGLILCAARLIGIMRRENLSHSHVHSCGDFALIAAIANRLAGARYSLTLHGQLFDYGGQQRTKFRYASFAIAITKFLRQSIGASLGSHAPSRIGVAPMGVNPSVFKRNMPFKPWEDGALRLFSCGRLNFAKGHQEVILATAMLKERGINVHLSIAGEDNLGGHGFRSELTATIDRLDLRNEVTLLGAVSEPRVLEELQRAHFFVLASHWEPLGVVIMEAMSCGVPVIATNAGGVPDIIDHNTNGYLVAPKSSEAIADAVMVLINDASLQGNFSSAGRETIIEKFNSNISARELKNLLDTVPESAELQRPRDRD